MLHAFNRGNTTGASWQGEMHYRRLACVLPLDVAHQLTSTDWDTACCCCCLQVEVPLKEDKPEKKPEVKNEEPKVGTLWTERQL